MREVYRTPERHARRRQFLTVFVKKSRFRIIYVFPLDMIDTPNVVIFIRHRSRRRRRRHVSFVFTPSDFNGGKFRLHDETATVLSLTAPPVNSIGVNQLIVARVVCVELVFSLYPLAFNIL